MTHLQFLENEAIYVLRETAAQFQKPAMLFSGGKDSIVMAWLARKAFHPSKLPFPLVHVDTGHNFHETIVYRDFFVKEVRADLVVGSVQQSIDEGRAVEEKGYNASRNKLQTITLLDTIEKHRFDACLGGGRRDDALPGRLAAVVICRTRIVGDFGHKDGIRLQSQVSVESDREYHRLERCIASNPVRGRVESIFAGVDDVLRGNAVQGDRRRRIRSNGRVVEKVHRRHACQQAGWSGGDASWASRRRNTGCVVVLLRSTVLDGGIR